MNKIAAYVLVLVVLLSSIIICPRSRALDTLRMYTLCKKSLTLSRMINNLENYENKKVYFYVDIFDEDSVEFTKEEAIDLLKNIKTAVEKQILEESK